MSTLVGHFVSSPSERENRDRTVSRGNESEGHGRKRERNESENRINKKKSTFSLTSCKGNRPCPTVSQYKFDTQVTQDKDTSASPNHPHVNNKHPDQTSWSTYVNSEGPDQTSLSAYVNSKGPDHISMSAYVNSKSPHETSLHM